MQKIKVLILDDFSLSYDGLVDLISSDSSIEILNTDKNLFELQKHSPVDVVILNSLTTKDYYLLVAKIKEQYSYIKIASIINDDTNLTWLLMYGVEGFINANDLNTDKLITCIQRVYFNGEYLDNSLHFKITEDLLYIHRLHHNGLTKRELQILHEISTGDSPNNIAKKLCISPKTLKNHLTSIYRKIGVKDRTQATLFAIKSNLASG